MSGRSRRLPPTSAASVAPATGLGADGRGLFFVSVLVIRQCFGHLGLSQVLLTTLTGYVYVPRTESSAGPRPIGGRLADDPAVAQIQRQTKTTTITCSDKGRA